MKRNRLARLALCLISVTAFVSLSAPAQQTDQSMPQFDLGSYQFGLLRRGPKWTPGSTAETKKIQEGHMANINRMAKLGKLVAAGPMAADGDLRGIFIFKDTSTEEAKALAAADPAIETGRLVLDVMPWSAPKGIGSRLAELMKRNVEPTYTMTTYYLALFNKGPQWSAADSPATRRLQVDHLWNIRRMLDARTFVSAGPLGSGGDLLGVAVIAVASLDEARAVAAADPAVKAGRLAVEIHPWWVAKEVWP